MTAGSGCGSFGETEATASDGGAGDGDVMVETPRQRTIVVDAGWPKLPALDPATDPRLSKIVVTVTDVTDATRRVTKELGPRELGPYALDLVTTNLVDVTVELSEGSGRILGYGERRRWNLATSDTVPVATRKRLLYFTSGDRDDGQLRMFDLAPAGKAEPGMTELAEPALPSLAEPTALYVTTDGLLLVQAGQVGTNKGPGQLSVFETGTHALSKTVALKYPLSAAVPLGDGHRLLGAPARSAQATTFTVVDVDGASSTDLPTGLQGGAITIAAMATSPDGARIAAVGSYSDGSTDIPYVFTYADGATTMRNTDLSALVEVARGVRFMPDGTTLVVAGAKADGSEWATGALLFFDASGPALTPSKPSIPLATGLTRASSLIIDPAGKYAYVGNETRYYGAGQSCCGDLRVIDLASGQEVALFSYGASGPELDLTEAVRLPYDARRVIAGQSDHGNNVHGPFVELLAGSPKPAAISYTASGDIGSINGLATPYGTRF